MNRKTTRGIALAALTAGFTILGATAANAIDLPDIGGDGVLGVDIHIGDGDSGDILGGTHVPLHAELPVTVDGLNLDVLGSNGTSSLLGDGVFATTGRNAMLSLFGAQGLDSRELLGNGSLVTVLGVPVDVSNSWVSVFGNKPNGIVVVPNLSALPTAIVTDGKDGLLDAFVTAPVNVSCSSVSVLSDYRNDCTGSGGSGGGDLGGDLLSGVLGGDLFGGDLLGGSPLGGAGLPDGSLPGVADGVPVGDGVVVDPTDQPTDVAGVPVDVSKAWLSVLGNRANGVVLVGDSTYGLSSLPVAGGMLETLALDCFTLTVASDFDRECQASSSGPTKPSGSDLGTLPLGDDNGGGAADTGGNGGNGGGNGGENLNPCTADLTSATTPVQPGSDVSLLVIAAAIGALSALAMFAAARRLHLI